MSDRDARRVHLTFHQQHVGIRIKQRDNRGLSRKNAAPAERLEAILCASQPVLGQSPESIAWPDDDSGRLATRITEMAIELILTAELQHREGAVCHYQWRVEGKAQLEEVWQLAKGFN